MTENSDFWFDYDRTPRDVTDMNGRRLEIGEEPGQSHRLCARFRQKIPVGTRADGIRRAGDRL